MSSSGSTRLFGKTQLVPVDSGGRVASASIGSDYDKYLPITKITTHEIPNVQLEQAFDGRNYGLDFGEMLVQIQASGIIPYPYEKCEDATDDALLQARAKLSELYRKHRMATANPITIKAGGDTFYAFVTGKACSTSTEQPNLINFVIDFIGVNAEPLEVIE